MWLTCGGRERELSVFRISVGGAVSWRTRGAVGETDLRSSWVLAAPVIQAVQLCGSRVGEVELMAAHVGGCRRSRPRPPPFGRCLTLIIHLNDRTGTIRPNFVVTLCDPQPA